MRAGVGDGGCADEQHPGAEAPAAQEELLPDVLDVGLFQDLGGVGGAIRARQVLARVLDDVDDDRLHRVKFGFVHRFH